MIEDTPQLRATRTPVRRRTAENVLRVKTAAHRQNGERPTEDQIWTAMKSKDTARNVRNIMWKGQHGGHKIGDYFRGMPAPWCDYATCPLCGTSETLQHIIFDCTATETETVWRLAKTFIEQREPDWPALDIGSVLGCPLLVFKDEDHHHMDKTTKV